MGNIHTVVFLLLAVGAALVIAIAWRWPMLGDRGFRRIEKAFSNSAARRVSPVLLVGLSVLVLRVALIPILGVPLPKLHDDFCHLLAADTFIHGRLTNPPHPMWIYLDTFHILQLPTYMSTYPPGQGAVLALGQLLGHPWIGVLLSMACLCGAITWSLRAWVPAAWALLGGALAVAQFSVANYWMEGYLGGAVAAIGGALVIGAIPRLLRRQQPKDAILIALGVAILANSRPYEGVLFCGGLGIAAVCFCLKKRALPRPKTILRLLLPFGAIMAATGAFIAYYNWRVTGNPLLLPWDLGFRMHFSSPVFLWQKLGPQLHYDNPQFEKYYRAMRAEWLRDHTWPGFKELFLSKMAVYLNFYTPPQFWLPMLAGLMAIPRSGKLRFCFGLYALLLASTLAIQTSMPHYLAPVTAAIYVLVVLGFRYLRYWKFNNRPVGVGLVRALVLFHLALLPLQAAAFGYLRHSQAARHEDFAGERAQFERQLEAIPGDHLVIVRYAQGHNPNIEFVFNRADVDHARVVWAREIPGRDMQPLLDYFHGRDVWLAEPDATPPQLSRFNPTP